MVTEYFDATRLVTERQIGTISVRMPASAGVGRSQSTLPVTGPAARMIQGSKIALVQFGDFWSFLSENSNGGGPRARRRFAITESGELKWKGPQIVLNLRLSPGYLLTEALGRAAALKGGRQIVSGFPVRCHHIVAVLPGGPKLARLCSRCLNVGPRPIDSTKGTPNHS